MDFLHFSLLTLAVLVVCNVQTGLSIKCYVCNSGKNYEGENCLNDKLSDDLLFDCAEKYPGHEKNYTMCRKLYQTVEGEDRVFRDCASVGDNRCVTRTGTKEIKIDYCDCVGDACNSANGIYSPIITVFVVLFALIGGQYLRS